jgi:hypothetical protein
VRCGVWCVVCEVCGVWCVRCVVCGVWFVVCGEIIEMQISSYSPPFSSSSSLFPPTPPPPPPPSPSQSTPATCDPPLLHPPPPLFIAPLQFHLSQFFPPFFQAAASARGQGTARSAPARACSPPQRQTIGLLLGCQSVRFTSI